MSKSDGNGQYMALVDLNGDGLPDFYSSGQSAAWLNTGSGFESVPISWPLPVSASTGGYMSKSDGNGQHMALVDLNGDGVPDLYSSGQSALWRGSADVSQKVASFRLNSAPLVAISYASSETNVYSRDSGSVFPGKGVDFRTARGLVASTSSSNGVGGTNTTNYSYGGLKAELGTGRGMLGFRWTKSQEVATGIESYTEYRQDFPYTGIPLLSETRLAGKGNAGVLKRNTNTVECKIPLNASACVIAPGNRYFPVVSSATEASWDLNGAAFPVITTSTTYVADANGQLYGDVGTIVVGTNDGSSKTTTNTYYPADTTNWILGRLKSATVVSVKP
jgi:hypothetical protein